MGMKYKHKRMETGDKTANGATPTTFPHAYVCGFYSIQRDILQAVACDKAVQHRTRNLLLVFIF